MVGKTEPTSTTTNARRRYWAVLNPMPAPMLTMAARQLEGFGVHGIFAPQVYGPPFIPLAAVAAVTERVQLASGIAIASARSPFETAMAAIDMDRISEGRFILGLGTSVAAWTCGVYGAPAYKPVTHLKDTIAAVRHIIAGAHEGLAPYEGTYYSADFQELQPTAPPVRTQIPVWIAALRKRLVQVAAEIGDGLIGHPMWSQQWALEHMRPEFEAALAAAGRKRSDVEVNLWPWAAVNTDEAQAIEDARPTMAFYGGVEQYEPFFEAHGFGDVARKLQAGVQSGDYRTVAHLVPDEMVRTFVAVGEPAKVREQIEKFWAFADSLCVVPPLYSLSQDKVLAYFSGISETFYPG
jgi:probable F420-dependent oxidoreductase